MSKKFIFTDMSITDTSKAKELIKPIVSKADSLNDDDILLLLRQRLGNSYTVTFENNYFTKQTEFTITK